MAPGDYIHMNPDISGLYRVTYGDMEFTSHETPGGNYRIRAYSPPVPPLKASKTVQFYRSEPFTTQDDVRRWSHTTKGRRFFTHRIGQELVAMFRRAIDAGEITVSDAREAKAKAKRVSDGTVYTCREYQDVAAKHLYLCTHNAKYALTDAWL